VLALVAGATTDRALLLGVAMVGLQVSIGALNDRIDVERDRGQKPGKPIPAGLVGQGTATAIVVGGLILGLGLSLVAGPLVALVAALGVGTGYLYDLRLKATAWGWLPFAVGLPLLPIYAWLGASGRIPEPFILLVALGVPAGAALALINGLVDIERDRAAALPTPAVRLGPARARRVAGALLAVVAAGAMASLVAVEASGVAVIVALVGIGVVALGLVLVGAGSPARRERGWEAGTIGIGLLAAGWAMGLAGRGLL
jgi:4-hydroxybenzoate polyprenyltransferase